MNNLLASNNYKRECNGDRFRQELSKWYLAEAIRSSLARQTHYLVHPAPAPSCSNATPQMLIETARHCEEHD